jgi:putative ABC transport system permease protein
MQKYMPTPEKEMQKRMTLDLNPLHDIYFEPAAPWDNVKHGSRNIVFIFLSISLIILGLACINFMNLATAKASDRSKEVGLRKVLGAVKSNLIYQFLGESFLLAAIPAIIAIVVVQLVTPAFNQFLGYTLPVFWNMPAFYIFFPAVIILVGILAGLYPALVLSSFSPIESLKGKLRVGKAGAFFRKGLVVFQFGISVLLIIATMVIMLQMNYVRATDLGFNKEQSLVLTIDNNDIYNNSYRFRKLVKEIRGVTDASLMSGEPGGFYDNFDFDVEGKEGGDWMFRTVFTDPQYVSTLGLKIVAGRNLSESFPTDSMNSVLVNEKTARLMGLTPQQAIGKRIRNQFRDSLFRTIVGVTEDFHFLSLKEEIQPLVISPGSDVRIAVVRLAPGDPEKVITDVKKLYTALAPGYPFEYNFLDQSFDKQYKTDRLQQDLLKSFAILGILIACLGLFGLASFTAVKRTKEIGVRKVLGSSIQGIVLLLSKDLLKPVIIGTILAIPIGYLVMRQWLENFAYRTPIYWWIYVVAILVSLVIALLTVSQQAFKAALSNPAKSLRTE